ncbi:MAG: glycosyltransferase family 39 protein [candidate division NC10 bacterium]|nr:glycosyltransferase family 39 protein [candidate division NC10 bacterium]
MVKRDPVRIVLLAGVLFVGLTLRLWGNSFGLPHHYAPDEAGKVKIALTLKERKFRHPQFQPSFLYNSLYLLFQGTRCLGFRLAVPGSGLDSSPATSRPEVYFHWIGRCWMALLDTITIYLVYRLGKRVGGREAGLVAAFLYAICPLPVVSAHYVKEDTPLTLGVCLATLLSLSVLRKGRPKDYVRAGLAAGAAFGSKFSGVATLPLLALAHFLRPGGRDDLHLAEGEKGKRRDLWLLIIGLSFLVGMALVCPYLFGRPGRLLKGLLYQGNYLLHGHRDAIQVGLGEGLLSFHLRKSLLPGLSLPVLAAALMGGWRLWKEKRSIAIILLAWCGGYYLFAELSPSKPYPFYARYLMPLVPHLCVLAGVGASTFLFRGVRDRAAKPLRWVGLAFLVCMLFFPAYWSLRYVTTMVPDTRDLAGSWIEENLPRGSIVMVPSELFYYSPRIDSGAFRKVNLDSETYRDFRKRSPSQSVFLVVNSLLYQRYLENAEDVPEKWRMYVEIFHRERLLKEFLPPLASYGFHNPVIRIYALRTGGDPGERDRTESASPEKGGR